MNDNNKTRIRSKNNKIEYKGLNCELVTIKPFFIGLFQEEFKVINIKYLCIGKIKNRITVLLQLDKGPDWSNAKKFIFNNIEPIFDSCLSPVDLYEELTRNFYIEYGQSDFNLNVSKLKKSEQENRLESFLRQLLEEHKNNSFTLDEVIDKTCDYLKNTKNCFQFNKNLVITKIESTFDFITNNLEDETIKDLSTFKDTEKINYLNQTILNLVSTLKKGHRVPFINIQGPSGIGKTELVKAILKHHQIPFNYMHSNFIFEEGKYNDDDALIDILDDISAFKIGKDANSNNDSYVKNIIGCNFKDTKIIVGKWQRNRILKRNKLTVIICNPGVTSFKNWSQWDKNPDKNYIQERQGIYIDFENDILYKPDPKAIIKQAENLFGSDKIEMIESQNKELPENFK